MKTFDKIRWIASILLVFFIVLITNIIDRDNFNQLSNSVTTMYQDRIVASDLLFDISRIIKEKQIATLTSDTIFFQNQNDKFNQEIDQLLGNYEITKLTEGEKFAFNQLQEELKSLKQKEKSFANLSNGEALKSLKKIDEYLHKLSKIQLQESKQQVFISNRAKDTVNLYTQIEIIFLILMAILVQIIILYKPKE
jgi:septal ring factor EnvC (AmiA/AmiB activator)